MTQTTMSEISLEAVAAIAPALLAGRSVAIVHEGEPIGFVVAAPPRDSEAAKRARASIEQAVARTMAHGLDEDALAAAIDELAT